MIYHLLSNIFEIKTQKLQISKPIFPMFCSQFMPRNHFVVHCIISLGANAVKSEMIKIGKIDIIIPYLALIRGRFNFFFIFII